MFFYLILLNHEFSGKNNEVLMPEKKENGLTKYSFIT